MVKNVGVNVVAVKVVVVIGKLVGIQKRFGSVVDRLRKLGMIVKNFEFVG